MTTTIEKARYTKGEELFNMITHIVGGGLGLVALFICVTIAAFAQNIWGVISAFAYGLSVILLFTMSSIYHGLKIGRAKKVFRILDHCTIFILIAGTYTPVLLTNFRIAYPTTAWTMFGILWGLAIIGITLNAIDLKKFMVFSLFCYIGMGWIAMFRINQLLNVHGSAFFTLILIGGIIYTIGVIFYVIGKKKKYMHGVFHLFVNVASILHSIAIAVFLMR